MTGTDDICQTDRSGEDRKRIKANDTSGEKIAQAEMRLKPVHIGEADDEAAQAKKEVAGEIAVVGRKGMREVNWKMPKSYEYCHDAS